MLFLDGHPEQDIRLQESDPFLRVGLGIFESFSVRNGRAIAPERHLARMKKGAAILGLPWSPLWDSEMADFLALQSGDRAIRLLLTAGGRRVITSATWKIVSEAALWSHPVIPSGLPPSVKHTQRAAWLLGEQRLGGELLFTEDGFWLETSRANLWVVREGEVWTPPVDGRILSGITRELVMEAALAAGIPVREAPVLAGPVEELYISSSLRDLCPVRSLDGSPLPEGNGIGARLQAAFRSLLAL